MNTKTMEGLTGARTNINLVNTPMRVYKEARRRGDLATMERAMGYAGDFAGKAEEYKVKADEGMKEEAKEAREKAQTEREKAMEKSKGEQAELEERLENRRGTDTVEVSEEGKVLQKSNVDAEHTDDTGETGEPAKEPVIYTKTGEAYATEQNMSISISV